MNKISYRGYRFPLEIIQQAIWLYLRFTLSLRDVEDLLAKRGVAVCLLDHAINHRWNAEMALAPVRLGDFHPTHRLGNLLRDNVLVSLPGDRNIAFRHISSSITPQAASLLILRTLARRANCSAAIGASVSCWLPPCPSHCKACGPKSRRAARGSGAPWFISPATPHPIQSLAA